MYLDCGCDITVIPINAPAAKAIAVQNAMKLAVAYIGIDTKGIAAIMYRREIVGLIIYSLDENKNGYVWCDLHAIEIITMYRRRGIGTRVIYCILKDLMYKGKKIRAIYGEAKYTAIPFWQKNNANFYMSNKKLQETYNAQYDAAFCLTLVRMQRCVKMKAE